MESKKNPQADINQRSKMFMAIGLIVSLSLTFTAFEWKTFEEGELMDLGIVKDDFPDLIDIPPTEIPEPKPPVIQQPTLIEVPDDEELEDEIEFDLDVEVTEETELANIEFEPELEEEKGDEVFLIVEEEASFPGGRKAWAKFLKKNFTYPRTAKRMGIEGKVFLSFVVSKDGSLSDIKVERGIGGGCDEAAVAVLEKSPKWNPGKQRGVPVNSRFRFYINFQLK